MQSTLFASGRWCAESGQANTAVAGPAFREKEAQGWGTGIFRSKAGSLPGGPPSDRNPQNASDPVDERIGLVLVN